MPTMKDTSVADERLFIKEFMFNPGIGYDPRAEMAFSDETKVRLQPQLGRIMLKRQPTGFFPIDDDLWVRTPVAYPKAIRQMMMLQIFGNFDRDDDITVNLRIFNGTDDYWWNSVLSQWEVAGASDWNDEATVNAHITEFPLLPDRKFAITLNLVTTNPEKTPYVREVRVLMKLWIDYMEDIIYRSLIPLIENEVQPLANYPLTPLLEDSDEIDLNDYPMNNQGFDIVDVERVFDFTSDDELLYDLLDSYNAGTKIITLTQEIESGHIPFVLFRYKPTVAYTTATDYGEDGTIEVASIPAIVLERIEVPSVQTYNLGAREGVVDKGTGRAYQIEEPWRLTIELRAHFHADNGVDEFRLMTKFMEFLDKNQMIRAIGTDERYAMQIAREMRDLIAPNRSDVHTFWTRFTIADVRLPFVAREAYGIRKLVVTFKEPAPPHEDPVKGGSRVILTSHSEDGPVAWTETIEITK